MSPWFPQETAGYIGAGIGILGGVFGTIAGVGGAFLRTPAHFTLLRNTLLAFSALGVALLLTGIYALITGQPYHVWYPFALSGLLFGVLPIAILPAFRNRLRMMDQRRLEGDALRNS